MTLKFEYTDADGLGKELAAGRYQTPFGIRFTFEIGEGYRGYAESFVNLAGVGKGSGTRATQLLLFWSLPPQVTVEEAVAELRDTPEATIRGSKPITLGEWSGVQLDLAAPTTDGKGRIGIPGIGKLYGLDRTWSTEATDPRLRFLLLDVKGRVLLAYIEAPPAEFETFVVEVESILNTVTFQ